MAHDSQQLWLHCDRRMVRATLGMSKTQQLSTAPHKTCATASTALHSARALCPRQSANRRHSQGRIAGPSMPGASTYGTVRLPSPQDSYGRYSPTPHLPSRVGRPKHHPAPMAMSSCLRKRGLRMPPDRLPRLTSSMSFAIPQKKV